MIDYSSRKELRKAKREHAYYKAKNDKFLAKWRNHETEVSTASESHSDEAREVGKL